VRNDPVARDRRRQRARERQADQAVVSESKHRMPDTPKEMLAFATELGWTYTKTRDGYRLLHPSGATACLHLSVSDKAAWRNLRCQLLRPTRRNGSTSD
jgi:hypothetical protein